MTSANVFNLSSVGQNQTLNANAATSKTKAGNSDTAVVFSSMMNVNYSTKTNANTDDIAQTSITTKQTDCTQNAYTQYSNRDREISSATMEDKLNSAADKLDDFDQKVVAKIAEDLGVDEDAVRSAMENLGLTAFGLMDPQNLVQLAVELTDAATPEDLLFQPQFVDLMQEMQTAQNELMDQLELMPDEMQDLLAQMNVLEKPQILDDASFAEVVQEVAETNTAPVTDTNVTDMPTQEQTSDVEYVVQNETITVSEAATENADQTKQDGSNANDILQRENEVHTADRTNANVAEQTPDMVFMTDQVLEEVVPQTENNTYLSIDTMDLIEQFAENVKVTIS